jgi:hypothetical protein
MTSRYLVFRSRRSTSYLCVCMARDAAHALDIAAQMFDLGRDAFAVQERPTSSGQKTTGDSSLEHSR